MSEIGNLLRERHTKLRKKIEVDAWGDGENPLAIYSTPITLAELKKIRQQSKGNNYEAIVYGVILKAEKEDGSKMFDLEDKIFFLEQADSELVSEIYNQMNTSIGFEEAAKNS